MSVADFGEEDRVYKEFHTKVNNSEVSDCGSFYTKSAGIIDKKGLGNQNHEFGASLSQSRVPRPRYSTESTC